MLIMVSIDLSMTNLVAFDSYEAKALALLVAQGGTVQRRIRSLNNALGAQILHFPSEDAFAHFMASEERSALHSEWLACGAKASLHFGKDVAVSRQV